MSKDVITLEQALVEWERAERVQELAGDRLDCCSYDQGPHEQDLYGCLTCQENGAAPAGICLGCMINCHADHEVFAMHVKRDFVCDCGNDRFNGVVKCQLQPHKARENRGNRYDKNFQNLYCRCVRTPEEDEAQDMIQCYVCQDWFHENCMISPRDWPETGIPDDTYLFICLECQKKHPLIRPYLTLPSGLCTAVNAGSLPSSSSAAAATADFNSSNPSSSSSPSASSSSSSPSPFSSSSSPSSTNNESNTSNDNNNSSSSGGSTAAAARVNGREQRSSSSSVLGKRKQPEGERKEEEEEGGEERKGATQECNYSTLPQSEGEPICDVYVAASYLKKVCCKCEACLARFRAAGIEFFLTEDPSRKRTSYAFLEDEEEEEGDRKAERTGATTSETATQNGTATAAAAAASRQQQIQALALEVAKELPPSLQLDAAEFVAEFFKALMEEMRNEIASLGEEGVFTVEHVHRVMRSTKERVLRELLGDLYSAKRPRLEDFGAA